MKPNIGQGDGGEAFGFGSGKRIPKESPQFEAVGTLDELSSALAYARSMQKNDAIRDVLEGIQRTLFALQAHVGAEENYEDDPRIPIMNVQDVRELEEYIVVFEKDLPELKNFIIPGNNSEAALLHMCRAVTRRAERRLVALSRVKKLNPNALAYVNRLSDVLFTLARHVAHKAGTEEVQWRP